MIVIYALVDPRNDEVRYIGQARNVQRRYAQHCDLTYMRGGQLKYLWIFRLASLDLRPKLRVLERVEGVTIRDATRYEAKWIAYYRARWHDVLNGPGGVYTTPARIQARAVLLHSETVAPGMLVGEQLEIQGLMRHSPRTL